MEAQYQGEPRLVLAIKAPDVGVDIHRPGYSALQLFGFHPYFAQQIEQGGEQVFLLSVEQTDK